MGGPVDMEWNGYELIGCWTHYMTNFDPIPNLDLGFLRSNFEIAPVKEWIVRFIWIHEYTTYKQGHGKEWKCTYMYIFYQSGVILDYFVVSLIWLVLIPNAM